MIRRHRVWRRERGYASGNVIDGSGSGDEGEMMTERLYAGNLEGSHGRKTLKLRKEISRKGKTISLTISKTDMIRLFFFANTSNQSLWKDCNVGKLAVSISPGKGNDRSKAFTGPGQSLTST